MNEPPGDGAGSTGIQRRGVVAVIARGELLLAIRRSPHVPAPGKICFPGGGLEAGESEEDALVRELREELGLAVRPIRRLWTSETPWRVALSWWRAEVDDPVHHQKDPFEVSEVLWLAPRELIAHPDLLTSNQEFLTALLDGTIVWDSRPPEMEGECA
jgi:8-oxo-dGTP diphosphatase